MHRRFAVLGVLVCGLLAVRASSASAQTGRASGQARTGRIAPPVDEAVLRRSAHTKLVCVACHTGLDPKSAAYSDQAEPVACLRCHADAQFKHPFHPEVARTIRSGAKPEVSCKECHGTHDVASAKEPGSKFSATRLTESCGKCHEKAAASFTGSAHEKALATAMHGAPTCLSCHRQSLVAARGTADSLAAKIAQARVCLSCHLDTATVRARMDTSTRFVPRWDHGPHGTLLQHGDSAAASCVSCHGSHGITRTSEPGSPLGRDSIVGTCAKCHGAIERKFDASVHGLARTSATTDSITCATCHSEHAKTGPIDQRTGVATRPVAAEACRRCHDPVSFSGNYGLSSDRFRGFSDSYHGLAMRDGVVEAANCASCHGAHDITPKGDTTSSVSTVNLVANCGRCHKGASERFLDRVHGKAGVRARPARRLLLPIGFLLVAGLAGGGVLIARRRRAQAA